MADKQLAAVRAIADQAGSGTDARRSLIASGAVPKLVKHLLSKTPAIASQSALALRFLAADPNTRPSVWEHQHDLVHGLVQALKTGGPLTQERSLATLAALIEHVSKAGAAVIKANGILPILRLAQTGSVALQKAAVSALNTFHVAVMWRAKRPADVHTFSALQHTRDLGEPLIRALSGGPEGAKLFALGVLRVLEGQPKVAQALRRPAVTELLYEFAAAEDVDIAATSLEVLTFAFGPRNCPEEAAPQDTAYHASPTLCKLWETLPCRLQSQDPSKHALGLAAMRYLDAICGWPGMTSMPSFRQCLGGIPALLQSPSVAVKLRGLYLARHAWLDRQTPEMDELCEEVLPVIISHLDPRPHAHPGGVLDDLDNFGHGTAKDPNVTWLAHHTYKYAFPSAGDDSSLRPTAKFTSRAELAEAAGLAVASLLAQPWGFHALLWTPVFTLASELTMEKLLPRGLVTVLGRLFSCESPSDPQRLILARSCLGSKFSEYLSMSIKGGPSQVVETARQAMDCLTQFVVEYAADPEFPKDDAVIALLCALSRCLHCAETFTALHPGVEAALTAVLTQDGGFDVFMAMGGGEWAITLISEGPMHTKMPAWSILKTAVLCGERIKGCVVLRVRTLEVMVGAALRPPAELASQAAMRLLCIATRSYGSGHTPADLAPVRPADESPDTSAGLANDNLAEMVLLGAVKAAIAHFRSFSAPPAPGGVCRMSGLDREAVAKFLCRLSWASGVFSDLQDNGGLQILVDLILWGEANERNAALEAVALLAYEEPAARPHLRVVGAITHLAAHLEGSSGKTLRFILLGLCLLISGTGRQPVPGAVDEVLATGAVPELLRILASQNENASFAFAALHYIACKPCGVAAIIKADYVVPLVSSLGLSKFCHTSTRLMENSTRVDVVHMIDKIAEERPDQGQPLFAAGLAAHLTTIFSSPLAMAERKLALQLVEKLSANVPGACDVLMGAGVLAELHKLAVAAPNTADPRCAADIPGAEEMDPLENRMPDGLLEAEAVQARALLCRLAGYCGGVLEIAGMDGELIRYTLESATCQSQCRTSHLETPVDVQERPSARVQRAAKRVCSLCGVVSEEQLRKCSRCRRARYCSQDCQAAHWPVHKGECRR